MRVLVTGGAGFIGSHITPALLAGGHEVVVLDNLTTGRREHVPEGATLIEGCITDAAALLADAGSFTHVIHLAALISSQDSLRHPDEYMQVNVDGLLRVLEATSKSSPRVVFASSSTVYGWNSGPGLSEQALPAPMTTYALSKLAGEHMLGIYSGILGFEHVALRLFNVYGPRQNPDHPYANVTCKFAKAAADHTPIKLFGDGHVTRDFVYVDDVASAFLAVLKSSKAPVYNVGTGAQSTIADLVEMTTKASGGRVEIEQCEAWANDIERIASDCALLQSEHGWSPTVSLDDGFNRTIEFFASLR